MRSPRCRTSIAGLASVLALGAVGLTALPVSASSEVVETTLISVAPDGTQANGFSSGPSVSGDGSTVVYHSSASNLVAGDTNGHWDVFAFDVASGATRLVSVASDGTQANGSSSGPSVSADGSTVVYRSYASNLVVGDTNGFEDVFVFDVGSGVTRRVSVASDGTQGNGHSAYPSVSADGSTITYTSWASNLVAGDTNHARDVFMFDIASGETSRVSVASDGTQANDSSHPGTVSANGSTIAYTSDASNLVVGDSNGYPDVFVFDVESGVTRRVSTTPDGTQANGFSHSASVSADGSAVVYQSDASNLVTGDTNGVDDVFLFDVGSGVTRRVSVASDGTQANDYSYSPSVSGDGSMVVHQSHASNLVTGDTNGHWDVFTFDVGSGVTRRVSVASDGTQANHTSRDPSVSADGSKVVYHSSASNLVAGDTNGFQDIYMTRINRSPEAAGFSATVGEDVAVGTVIGTVSGSDLDTDPLTYTISAGNAAGLFAVGSSSGVVTVAKALDYETATSHTLMVTVSDGSLADTATATITVTDVDETEPPPPPSDPFIDDDGSVFEADIEWIAANGVTKRLQSTHQRPVLPRQCGDAWPDGSVPRPRHSG